MANLISLEEAAKRLGSSPEELNELRQKGKLFFVCKTQNEGE